MGAPSRLKSHLWAATRPGTEGDGLISIGLPHACLRHNVIIKKSPLLTPLYGRGLSVSRDVAQLVEHSLGVRAVGSSNLFRYPLFQSEILRSYRKPIFTLCGEVLIPFSEDNFLLPSIRSINLYG